MTSCREPSIRARPLASSSSGTTAANKTARAAAASTRRVARRRGWRSAASACTSSRQARWCQAWPPKYIQRSAGAASTSNCSIRANSALVHGGPASRSTHTAAKALPCAPSGTVATAAPVSRCKAWCSSRIQSASAPGGPGGHASVTPCSMASSIAPARRCGNSACGFDRSRPVLANKSVTPFSYRPIDARVNPKSAVSAATRRWAAADSELAASTLAYSASAAGASSGVDAARSGEEGAAMEVCDGAGRPRACCGSAPGQASRTSATGRLPKSARAR